MNGARIGITAARRAAEQAALVTSLGGVPVIGSALRPDAPQPDDVIAPAVEEALAEPIDIAVFLTGVGARIIFDFVGRAGCEQAFRDRLAGARVVVRGTKPRRVLRTLGVRVDEMVDPPVAAAVRDTLLAGDVADSRCFVQGFGPPPVDVTEPLSAAGARVMWVSPYAAGLPDDPAPAATLARDAIAGDIAALTFTSALAARQFVGIADAAGVEVEDLDAAACRIVAVGPVTRDALVAEGLRVDVEPQTPRMGAMYHALAAALRAG